MSLFKYSSGDGDNSYGIIVFIAFVRSGNVPCVCAWIETFALYANQRRVKIPNVAWRSLQTDLCCPFVRTISQTPFHFDVFVLCRKVSINVVPQPDKQCCNLYIWYIRMRHTYLIPSHKAKQIALAIVDVNSTTI